MSYSTEKHETFQDANEYFYKQKGVHCEEDPEQCESEIKNLEKKVEHLKNNDDLLTKEMKMLHERLSAAKSEKDYCMKKQEELRYKVKTLEQESNGSKPAASSYTPSFKPAGHR